MLVRNGATFGLSFQPKPHLDDLDLGSLNLIRKRPIIIKLNYSCEVGTSRSHPLTELIKETC